MQYLICRNSKWENFRVTGKSLYFHRRVWEGIINRLQTNLTYKKIMQIENTQNHFFPSMLCDFAYVKQNILSESFFIRLNQRIKNKISSLLWTGLQYNNGIIQKLDHQGIDQSLFKCKRVNTKRKLKKEKKWHHNFYAFLVWHFVM